MPSCRQAGEAGLGCSAGPANVRLGGEADIIDMARGWTPKPNCIHITRVKHGLVARAADWPHSSFHLYVRNGYLPQDWAGAPPADEQGFGERSWKDGNARRQ
jgi:hypothetical protein